MNGSELWLTLDSSITVSSMTWEVGCSICRDHKSSCRADAITSSYKCSLWLRFHSKIIHESFLSRTAFLRNLLTVLILRYPYVIKLWLDGELWICKTSSSLGRCSVFSFVSVVGWGRALRSTYPYEKLKRVDLIKWRDEMRRISWRCQRVVRRCFNWEYCKRSGISDDRFLVEYFWR